MSVQFYRVFFILFDKEIWLVVWFCRRCLSIWMQRGWLQYLHPQEPQQGICTNLDGPPRMDHLHKPKCNEKKDILFKSVYLSFKQQMGGSNLVLQYLNVSTFHDGMHFYLPICNIIKCEKLWRVLIVFRNFIKSIFERWWFCRNY